MPVRDQYQRIHLIDQILSAAQQGLSARQILEILNQKLPEEDQIGLRTLQNDITALREGHFGSQVALNEERRGRGIYYRYAEGTLSAYAFRLTPGEMQQIRQAMGLLERSGEYFVEIEQLKRKLNPMATHLPPIEFDDNPDYIGRNWMPLVTDAISRTIPLTIEYQPFERAAYRLVLHPYRLREYNNRWYVCGLVDPAPDPAIQTVLALDRIQGMEYAHQVLPRPNPFDAEYFEDVIGITVNPNEPIARVRLQFEPSRAEYVRTKPLHRTQRGPYPAPEGWQEYTIDVRHNRELVATILTFAEDVRVMEPERLRQDVAQRHLVALGHYQV
jgi:predicted DNA-binding transcriptional regulator YafY